VNKPVLNLSYSSFTLGSLVIVRYYDGSMGRGTIFENYRFGQFDQT